MPVKFLRIWPWLAAILSGVLLTLCFPRWNQTALCWTALAPLIAAVWFGGNPSPRRAALLGYVTGLVFFWGVFSWLTNVTGVGWFLLPFYLALYPASWAAFLSRAGRNPGDFTRSTPNLLLAIQGAAAWVALEWLRGLGALSFGWNGLGVALHGKLAFLQITEFTGVGGLSFLIAFTNLIAVITVRRLVSEIRLRRFRAHWDFNLNMALIVAVFMYGIRVLLAPGEPETIPLRVAAVQANIPQAEKFDQASAQKITECYGNLTKIAFGSQPHLLLWPEAATPNPLFSSQDLYDSLAGIADRAHCNFLFGTLDSDLDTRCDYNIAALFTQRGQTLQTYRKMHLVPFGEYIPWRRAFPPFEWVIGNLVPADFTPGTEHKVLKLENPSLNAAALICFEDTLGDLTRHFVLGGAQLLVNVTNDGWFQESPGAEQHLANAVFRAVENRRPLVRAANTGVTAFIDTRGRITASCPPFGPNVLEGTVQVPGENARLTFYTRQGERFSQACALLSVITLGRFISRRRKPSGAV